MTPEATFSESISSGMGLMLQESAASKTISKQAPTSQRISARVARPASGDLAAILNELNSLGAEDETDEEGYIFKPESIATNRAITYVLKAYRVPSFSRPKIEPDGEGGIVLDWRRNDRIVRLALRAKPNQRDYIYYQSKCEHSAKAASLPFLLDRLHWLTKDE